MADITCRRTSDQVVCMVYIDLVRRQSCSHQKGFSYRRYNLWSFPTPQYYRSITKNKKKGMPGGLRTSHQQPRSRIALQRRLISSKESGQRVRSRGEARRLVLCGELPRSQPQRRRRKGVRGQIDAPTLAVYLKGHSPVAERVWS